MSRVGRYERGTYVLCVRLGAGSAHGCAHCTMQRGNCMHAESPMRLRCVSPCGDAFDRRRSTSVDGARGELGSCLSRAHPPTLGIWWSRSRMGMALRVMSRCVSCPRPLPGSCSLIRTMGGQSSLCVSPPGRGVSMCGICISVSLQVRPLRETLGASRENLGFVQTRTLIPSSACGLMMALLLGLLSEPCRRSRCEGHPRCEVGRASRQVPPLGRV